MPERSLDLHNSKGLRCTNSPPLQLFFLAAWQSRRFAYSCETTPDDEATKPWHLAANTVHSSKMLAHNMGLQNILAVSHVSVALPQVERYYFQAFHFHAGWWWKWNATSPQHTWETGIALMRWSSPLPVLKTKTNRLNINGAEKSQESFEDFHLFLQPK